MYKLKSNQVKSSQVKSSITISIILLMLLSWAGPSLDVSAARPLAASDPGLGTAANASILSTTLLTNAGSSSTNRDVDVSPLSQVQPAGLTVGGAFHSADGVAAAVLADAGAADGNMLGQPLTSNLGALDGLTLVSGVYDIGAGQLNGGVLTLDGPGFYVFRASSSLVSSGSINFINGARACDLYWHVASLATINGSSFAGTIIAGTGVHFGDSVTLDGRALAINGDVTLINDTITGPSCAAPPTNTPTPTVTPTVTPTATVTLGLGTPSVTPTVTPTITTTPGLGTPSATSPSPTRTRLPVVTGLPNTGGAPIQNRDFPGSLAIVGSFSAIALFLGIQAYRRARRMKQ